MEKFIYDFFVEFEFQEFGAYDIKPGKRDSDQLKSIKNTYIIPAKKLKYPFSAQHFLFKAEIKSLIEPLEKAIEFHAAPFTIRIKQIT